MKNHDYLINKINKHYQKIAGKMPDLIDHINQLEAKVKALERERSIFASENKDLKSRLEIEHFAKQL